MLLIQADIKRILIFRALQLGDMLCAIPAIRALRHAYPYATISLAGLPWASALVERFPSYFDDFISFPGYPGLPEQELDPAAFIRFLSEVQKRHFDLALQMQGDGSVINPMMELLGASNIAGFRKEGHYAPENALFIDYPAYGSEIERHLKLMHHLGIPAQGTELEFTLTEKDQQEYDELRFPVGTEDYVCVHPGSRGAWRQWPVVHFAALADLCMKKGLKVVITGTKEELPIVGQVVEHMTHKPLIAAGKTGLGAAGILINNSYALISNCTGVSHMASAFKKRSIVISMDGEPERWGPLDRQTHCVFDWTRNKDFNLVLSKLEEILP
jgi:ADP-heptose:LPS heptosyltransferase